MANAINMPTPIPTFGAVNNADQLNVTGDGTIYQILFADELWDTRGAFAASTWTAPVTGKYVLGISLYLGGLTAAMTNALIYIVAGGINYRLTQLDFSPGQDVAGVYIYSASALCPMNATDTAQVFVRILNGTKVADLLGATGTGVRSPYFYGYLLAEV
jgi:hypothetical protein